MCVCVLVYVCVCVGVCVFVCVCVCGVCVCGVCVCLCVGVCVCVCIVHLFYILNFWEEVWLLNKKTSNSIRLLFNSSVKCKLTRHVHQESAVGIATRRRDGRPEAGVTLLPLTAAVCLMPTRNKNKNKNKKQKKPLKQNYQRYMIKVIPDQNAEKLNGCP